MASFDNNNEPSDLTVPASPQAAPTFRIAIQLFKETATAGAGGVTRALAIRNALDRAGYLAPNGPVEVWLVGVPDSPDLWPDPDRTLFFEGGTNLTGPGATAQIRAYCDRLGQLNLDLLILDNHARLAQPLISPKLRKPIYEDPEWEAKGLRRNIVGFTNHYRADRPTQVWYLSRHSPGQFGDRYSVRGFPMYAIDRFYLLEPHMLYTDGYRDDYAAISKPRSNAQREADEAGILGPIERPYMAQPSYWQWHFENLVDLVDLSEDEIRARYQTYLDEVGYMPMAEYQRRHFRPGWKLLSPVVNVDPAQVLDRGAARQALCEWFGLDSARPIALLMGRQNWISQADLERFSRFKAQLENQADRPQVIELGGRGSGFGHHLPQAWRYYAGADYVAVAAGYNAFWELRLLKRLGLFGGQMGVVAHENANDDQLWRARTHIRGALDDQYYWGYAAFQPASQFDNGADELAHLIGRRAGLVRKEVKTDAATNTANTKEVGEGK